MGDKGVHAFPKGISPQVNIIAQLEFEPAYNDIPVEYVSNSIMEINPFGLECLFNGISTFIGYLMPKLSL